MGEGTLYCYLYEWIFVRFKREGYNIWLVVNFKLDKLSNKKNNENQQ